MLKKLPLNLYQIIKMHQQGDIKEQDIPKILDTHLQEFKGKQLQFDKRLGMTNETYKVSAEGTKTVIFRILSPIVDRKYENEVLKQLQVNNICPKTLYSCQKYRIEEFIENVEHPPSEKINNDPELMKKIIAKLYEMHNVKLPKNLQRSFLDDIFFTQSSLKRYKNLVCLQKGKEDKFLQLKQELLKNFESMYKNVKSHFKNRESSFKLSHNDANSGNIFLKTNGNQEIILIDFEYACYNYVSYDIANFLNECCFQYNSTYPGFKVFKKVSSEDIKKACDYYEGKYENMDQDVHFMLMVCNYFWGFWSLEATPSEDFSPIEHGIARLELFSYYAENNSRL